MADEMLCKTCGKAADTLFYRRGSSEETVMCGPHGRQFVRSGDAAGWLSQSANTAASPTGRAIRSHLQAASG